MLPFPKRAWPRRNRTPNRENGQSELLTCSFLHRATARKAPPVPTSYSPPELPTPTTFYIHIRRRAFLHDSSFFKTRLFSVVRLLSFAFADSTNFREQPQKQRYQVVEAGIRGSTDRQSMPQLRKVEHTPVATMGSTVTNSEREMRQMHEEAMSERRLRDAVEGGTFSLRFIALLVLF